MALETIPVVLSHDNVQQYLSKLNERAEGYGFDVSETAVRGRPIKLQLWRDGEAEDALSIELNPNGTWTASHRIIVGEKQ